MCQRLASPPSRRFACWGKFLPFYLDQPVVLIHQFLPVLSGKKIVIHLYLIFPIKVSAICRDIAANDGALRCKYQPVIFILK